jgi:hypothetical protein
MITRRSPRTVRRLWQTGLLTTVLVAATTGIGATTANAATTCDPAGDVCVVVPDSVATPLGLVTVTTNSTGAVSVHLDPVYPNTLVVGVPFALEPGLLVSGCPGGCTRTNIDTVDGLVSIDTITIPPGPPARFSLPNLAIISIHPPSPCRARTLGTTVTFTPIYPPGPPS